MFPIIVPDGTRTLMRGFNHHLLSRELLSAPWSGYARNPIFVLEVGMSKSQATLERVELWLDPTRGKPTKEIR
ncbi:hypothetical protein N7449_009575 [Penicillium cf. viridicatum]|uniref:Uncharacterized protein n=1 Tax=Penicillium cf. viridicatum TaxID=2972119 RepID=A0A9W9M960_9EURO|nr:hypothetical protein N7449_009575 [Penicillium cf. viridicatum]